MTSGGFLSFELFWQFLVWIWNVLDIKSAFALTPDNLILWAIAITLSFGRSILKRISRVVGMRETHE